MLGIKKRKGRWLEEGDFGMVVDHTVAEMKRIKKKGEI
jgi:hypothetical protein